MSRVHGLRSLGTIRVLALASALVALASGHAEATLLWGLDTDDDTLFTVDNVSGAVNTIGGLPSFTFGGLDFDSSGNLYALLLSPDFVAELYLVDPNDASSILVGSSNRVFESFEIIGSTGYSADVFEENLYSVNLLDGSATLIGSHNTDAGDNRITGLASDEATLFGTRIFSEDLVRLNALGGVDAVIGVHGLSSNTSLAFADGVFWSIPALTNTLYSLSPVNAAPTAVFPGLPGLGHVTGLTAAPRQEVPEPGTLSLLGVALLGTVGYLRRRAAQRKTGV